MSVPRTVLVTQSGPTLTLDPPNVEVNPGEAVVWKFLDPSPGLQVFIAFDGPPVGSPSSDPPSPLGPFQSLVPFSSTVIGLGNSGNPGTYNYRALVLSLDNAAASAAGTVAVSESATVPDISPNAQVTFSPHAVIEPSTLSVAREGTAVWMIENPPVNSFVTFQFGASPDEFPDPLTGPFVSISTSRGPGSSLVVIGEGLLTAFPARSDAPIHYFMSARDALGNILSAAPDPVIEPVGSPPTG